jgi:hypothetical protein
VNKGTKENVLFYEKTSHDDSKCKGALITKKQTLKLTINFVIRRKEVFAGTWVS